MKIELPTGGNNNMQKKNLAFLSHNRNGFLNGVNFRISDHIIIVYYLLLTCIGGGIQ